MAHSRNSSLQDSSSRITYIERIPLGWLGLAVTITGSGWSGFFLVLVFISLKKIRIFKNWVDEDQDFQDRFF